MPIEVIGAGFGRTGSTSLKIALEQLGYGKCYHMVEVLKHPSHAQIWHAAYLGQEVNWEALLRGYRSAVDWPVCTFYAELLARYPDAKVVLTVRDPERWYASALATIYQVRHADLGNFNWLIPNMRHVPTMINALIWDGAFDGRFEEKEHAIAVYRRHIEAVKRSVPPEQLLVFEVSDGWAPLCQFLGKPTPSSPFPHANDAAQFKRLIALRAFLLFHGPRLVAAGMLLGALLLWRRSRRSQPVR